MQIAQEDYDDLHRLHNIFVKSKDGAETLKKWEQLTFYEPGIKKNEPEHMIYIREGEKLFLRKILIKLKQFQMLPAGKDLEIVDALDLTSP